MAISKELLDILVCPQCKTPVTLSEDGTVLRAECGENLCEFPVRDDIPVMLMDEAKITPKQSA